MSRRQWRLVGASVPGAGAFTLVELLFTIAIIAILMGLLLPTLRLARGSAEGAVCQSNLRQVSVALHAFAADHRDQFPRNRTAAGSGDQDEPRHTTWRAFMVRQDYLPGEAGVLGEPVGELARAGGQGATGATEPGSVWRCPSNVWQPLREHIDGPSTCVGDVAAQYAYNGEIAWEAYPLTGPEPAELRLVTIARPSETIVLAETRSWWPDLRLRSMLGRGQYPGADQDGGGYFSFWHAAASGNWALYDGSVQQMTLRDTFDPELMWFADGERPASLAVASFRAWLGDRYR